LTNNRKKFIGFRNLSGLIANAAKFLFSNPPDTRQEWESNLLLTQFNESLYFERDLAWAIAVSDYKKQRGL
jgi:hypothetical protein